MWFGVHGRECINVPAVSLDGISLKVVTTQKYLGMIIDHRLTWKFQVAKVCKKKAYYLYLINCHQKELPMHILRMMVDSLVLSQLNYALPVWGPPLSSDLINCLRRLHNRAVHVVFSLCKYDHVSSHRSRLGWLPLESTIQYRSLLAMHQKFVGDCCLLLNPPIEFGTQHQHHTRALSSFANIYLSS